MWLMREVAFFGVQRLCRRFALTAPAQRAPCRFRMPISLRQRISHNGVALLFLGNLGVPACGDDLGYEGVCRVNAPMRLCVYEVTGERQAAADGRADFAAAAGDERAPRNRRHGVALAGAARLRAAASSATVARPLRNICSALCTENS